jgi:hypothetical protein
MATQYVYQRAMHITNGNKIFQMVIKYTHNFHFNVLQNIPQLVIFGIKINHLATLGQDLNKTEV